ncbi:septation ring formation regulator EzrA [Jeotgalibacillus sp. R-1-5s-1]|uniref:septation ring formation regulator EzrA n=1 Tax=Jeotgalibacillus sp. R-1-5s-1 TaxID=2555897 RepID=UPI00106A1964|nr:septation ring formation regulator EzrA [Jeotgalibacillus sp. R-1-5s-1]TFD98211.1 hypothetical protein E2491_08910 [Jeotgalibacillus sp. R-1-5s-1]
MEYIIGSVLFALILIGTAFFWRKKQYKEVDVLEEQKLDIQHRPVLEEMTKVKQLNMNGQTEELFEKWRDSWTYIVDEKLAEVDSLLFDAEEHIDKFRFNKSKKVREAIEEELKIAEEQMNVILQELEDLMGSDEKNREEMEYIQQVFKESRSRLMAERHSFGKSAEALERKIYAVEPKLDEYQSLTGEGNYLQARELVLALVQEINDIQSIIERLPSLNDEVQYSLPSQRSELKDGFNEMSDKGFPLSHLGFEKADPELESQIGLAQKHLLRLELDEADDIRQSVQDTLDQFYDQLEDELEARSKLNEKLAPLSEKLKETVKRNEELTREVDYVRQGYQLDQTNLDLPKDHEKQLERITREFHLMTDRRKEGETAFTILAVEAEKLETELAEIEEQQKNSSSQLQKLRSDEITVRELQDKCFKKLKELVKLVSQKNLPKIPDYWHMELKEVNNQLEQIDRLLTERPMNMKLISQHSSSAERMTEAFEENTSDMMNAAESAERVIQYGNRYRSKNEVVFIGLNEAEMLFRRGQYQEALEQAAETIEKVEPGVLKKIDDLKEQHV